MQNRCDGLRGGVRVLTQAIGRRNLLLLLVLPPSALLTSAGKWRSAGVRAGGWDVRAWMQVFGQREGGDHQEPGANARAIALCVNHS